MSGEPRAFFAAMVPSHVRDPMEDAVRLAELDRRLGGEMVVPENWHQTLSARHFSPSDALLARLRRAGDRIEGNAFRMQFNRIAGGRQAPFHWEFRVRGEPYGFRGNLAAVQRGLASEQLEDDEGHRPHSTLSYRAPGPLETIIIQPVEWLVDEFQLVVGGGLPYRYHVVERWALRPIHDQTGAQFGLL